MNSNSRIDPRAVAATCIALLMMAAQASAQPSPPFAMPPHPPSVTLSAAATASVPNDRMHASLRAEADNADAAAAANVVNTRMAKALARARAVAGVEASTTGYSSFQITDKAQVTRWRVAQTLKLEGSDFTALSALISQLQGDGGLVVDGTQFSVSDAYKGRGRPDAAGDQIVAGSGCRGRARIRLRRLAGRQRRHPDRRILPPAAGDAGDGVRSQGGAPRGDGGRQLGHHRNGLGRRDPGNAAAAVALAGTGTRCHMAAGDRTAVDWAPES